MRFSDLYEAMTPEQRVAFAAKVGKSPGYMWQIANRWEGRKPSLPLLQAMLKADRRLKAAELLAEYCEPAKAKA